jgi:hypothetical protein
VNLKLCGKADLEGMEGEMAWGVTHHTVGMLHAQELAQGRLGEGDRPWDTTMNTRKKMKLGASICDSSD